LRDGSMHAAVLLIVMVLLLRGAVPQGARAA
jgi:hypothetical protein